MRTPASSPCCTGPPTNAHFLSVGGPRPTFCRSTWTEAPAWRHTTANTCARSDCMAAGGGAGKRLARARTAHFGFGEARTHTNTTPCRHTHTHTHSDTSDQRMGNAPPQGTYTGSCLDAYPPPPPPAPDAAAPPAEARDVRWANAPFDVLREVRPFRTVCVVTRISIDLAPRHVTTRTHTHSHIHTHTPKHKFLHCSASHADLLQIFTMLPSADIVRAGRACRRWQSVALSPEIIKRIRGNLRYAVPQISTCTHTHTHTHSLTHSLTSTH